MGRWSNEKRAQEAAKAAEKASEAGRALQQLKQKAEKPEEPKSEPKEAKPERPADWRPPQRNDPRRKMLEEMEQKALERSGEAPPTPKPEVPDNPPPPTAEQMLEGGKFSDAAPPADSTSSKPAAPAAEQVEAAPKTVKVKIYGEELDVPEAEVEEAGGVKPYQIIKAQERQLKQANETLAETKRMQQLMAQLLEKQSPPAAPEPTDEEFIKSRVDAIRFGTPEESATALREIMGRNRVDPQAMYAEATARFQHDVAVRQFDRDFADIVKDRDLLQLAYVMRNQDFEKAKREGKSVDWNEFYSNIGNRIRSKFGRQTPPATSPQVPSGQTSQPDKEARKASIVNLPTAAGRASPPAEEKPATREEILNQARKARGQPTG